MPPCSEYDVTIILSVEGAGEAWQEGASLPGVFLPYVFCSLCVCVCVCVCVCARTHSPVNMCFLQHPGVDSTEHLPVVSFIAEDCQQSTSLWGATCLLLLCSDTPMEGISSSIPPWASISIMGCCWQGTSSGQLPPYLLHRTVQTCRSHSARVLLTLF